MASSADLPLISIAEAGHRLRSGALTSVELTELCLERIDRFGGSLHTYGTVTRDLALEQARAADAELASGRDRGPLHGIPIGLKDLYDTAGILTSANSRAYRDRIPGVDATATRLLREAGTVLLGKLVMHEFAFGNPTTDSLFPPAANPWLPAHIPGGSSSGSGAALAAGLCYGALGSDTGGSIRGPAAHCGIVGIKPTFGLVSRVGVVPLSWSLDHAGPMARTVEDCALLLQAIAGPDAADPWSANVAAEDYTAKLGQGVAGKRLGVPRDWLSASGIHEEIIAAFDAATAVFESLGAELVDIDSGGFASARAPTNLILIAEAFSFHEARLKKEPEVFGAGIVNRIREGGFISSADYLQALKARGAVNARMAAAMAEVDAVILPTMPQPPAPFEGLSPEANYRSPSFMMPFNASGLPALSLPSGFTRSGLPIGLQVAGHAFEEAEVLGIAAAYEAATDWHTRFPDL
jgi:aspartyl-tRNA(Asn)/glutamyl-tRNA(Gln) amidotransferase subunit A